MYVINTLKVTVWYCYFEKRRCNMERKILIGQGKTAEVFEWETDKILKLFRQGIPKKIIEYEYESSLNIYKKLNLIPKVYKVVKMENRYGIIYERINGITMMKTIASKPWTLKREAKKLAELHKCIQQEVDFKLSNYKIKLKNDISKTDLLSNDIKMNLYKYIEKLDDGNVLCHGDFHPENIILTKNKQIVIDWMTATKSSPAADVARTSIIFKFGIVLEKTYIEEKIINFIRNMFYEEYLKHYISISEVKIEQIQQWELPVAAARLNESIPEKEKSNILKYINKRIGLIC